ncbi:MAG: DUF362 domain-containing protein, partial [Myxococcota bacterium]|nr:DUF362 domain-containing protein [Myxococcota bacterium]
NRCFYYSDAKGERWDAPAPVRRTLTVLDGVVAGEGNGPLAPDDRPLGAVLAATDPIALDLAALRLMGFDARRIPKVWEALRAETLRITAVRTPGDVVVSEAANPETTPRDVPLDALATPQPFRPHPGWRGHVEQISCAA